MKRKNLLNCSNILFINKGYEQTSINEIINQANVAKGTFYYYFKSKEKVLHTLVEKYLDQLCMILKSLKNNHSITSIDDLLIVLQNIYNDQKVYFIEETQIIRKIEDEQINQKILNQFINRTAPLINDLIHNASYIDTQSFSCIEETTELVVCYIYVLCKQNIFDEKEAYSKNKIDFMLNVLESIFVSSKKNT
ncbi:TetR/AcrR family transcriptional regulator [Candidatus Izemoplasma sp. B36]|uniref:TetR/AcrR family transcriptional regulator n=1 Tax=Candidatus Izemoplasma sp. B36 TaxID=3242468 RepID=UPI00355649C1